MKLLIFLNDKSHGCNNIQYILFDIDILYSRLIMFKNRFYQELNPISVIIVLKTSDEQKSSTHRHIVIVFK